MNTSHNFKKDSFRVSFKISNVSVEDKKTSLTFSHQLIL